MRINTRINTFNEHSVPFVDVCGAGIVPIMKNSTGVYICMAQEKWAFNWKSSNKWSSFEGGKKHRDATVEDIAVREFLEESLGAIQLEGISSCEHADIVGLIRDEMFVHKLITQVMRREPTYHVTYLMQVTPEQALQATERFRKMSDFFIHVRTLATMMKNCLWQFTDLVDGRVLSMRHLSCDDTHLNAIYIDDRGWASVSLRKTEENATQFHALCAHFCLKERLNRLLYQIEHDALDLTRDARGDIIDVDVLDEYTEKRDIRWWPVQELQRVFDVDCTDRDNIRPYFLPVLQHALDILS